MAFGFADPVTWGIVFVAALVLEVVIVMNIRAEGAGGKGGYAAASAAPTLADGEALTDILSRFVKNDAGETVGETVGMDGDKVIVKDGAAYKAIPRASLKEADGDFVVDAGVDWDAAAKDGEDWKTRQHKEITYTSDELPEEERPGAAS